MRSVKEIAFGVVLCMVGSAGVLADWQDEFAYGWYTNSVGTVMPYRYFVHSEYSPANEHPLLLCLHGAGGRGTDNQGQLNDQAKLCTFFMDQVCIIVAPQQNSWWGPDEMQLAHDIVLGMTSAFRVDTNRVYVTGLSQGGNGTWRALSVYTNTFAAGGPVCGWGDLWLTKTNGPPDYSGYVSAWAPRLTRTPIWAWHGSADNTVPFNNSAFMIDQIQKELLSRVGVVDSNVLKLTRLAGVGHAAWNHAYVSDEFKTWLFAQRLGGIIDGDGDRMDDDWEVRHLNSVTNSAGGGNDDWDRDGFIDLYEFLAGTNPTNDRSMMVLSEAAEDVVEGQYVLRWQAVAGKTYSLLSCTNLEQAAWTTNAFGIEGVEPECVHTISVHSANAFFQIRLD